jgi:hypothetical protein
MECDELVKRVKNLQNSLWTASAENIHIDKSYK